MILPVFLFEAANDSSRKIATEQHFLLPKMMVLCGEKAPQASLRACVCPVWYAEAQTPSAPDTLLANPNAYPET